jgi:hypothetical protein
MQVIVSLTDEVYGNTRRVYDIPGLKRTPAICKAVEIVRKDYSLRMYRISDIRTSKSNHKI